MDKTSDSTESILAEHGKRFVNNRVKILPYIVLNRVIEFVHLKIVTRDELDAFLKKLQKEYKTVISRKRLLMTYRDQCLNGLADYDPMFEMIFQSKPFRSESGVLAYGIMLSPYPTYTVKKSEIDMEEMVKKDVKIIEIGKSSGSGSGSGSGSESSSSGSGSDEIKIIQQFSCAFDCGYCPKKPGQPRSYLEGEPAVARANRLNFIIKRQIWDRLDSYFLNGHPLNKVDAIVLGGTFDSFPIPYQQQSMAEIYYSHNQYYEYIKIFSKFKIDNKELFETHPDKFNSLLDIELSQLRKILTVAEEIKINETARC
jgi:histone acetyltransferase (RNA polymerase elongator complex component)